MLHQAVHRQWATCVQSLCVLLPQARYSACSGAKAACANALLTRPTLPPQNDSTHTFASATTSTSCTPAANPPPPHHECGSASSRRQQRVNAATLHLLDWIACGCRRCWCCGFPNRSCCCARALLRCCCPCLSPRCLRAWLRSTCCCHRCPLWQCCAGRCRRAGKQRPLLLLHLCCWVLEDDVRLLPVLQPHKEGPAVAVRPHLLLPHVVDGVHLLH
jgi:hypothetical protein